MNISNSLCYAFGVSAAAVAILAGCSNGGSPSSFAPSGATQQSVTQAGADAQTRGSVTQYYLVNLGVFGGNIQPRAALTIGAGLPARPPSGGARVRTPLSGEPGA